ncbi:hypothetical protein [Euzebya rosea]|uniref:hypothetical protein n=1 Tax=Euzebya rosea TaxID=2052804 RepID=UPI000D3EDE79|nr:hypothetical protein [Euzebya rosea]
MPSTISPSPTSPTTIRTRRFGAALISLLLLGTACGGGEDGDQRQLIVDALTEGGAVTQTQAECVVDGLYEELDADTVNALDPSQDEVDDPEVAAVLQEAFQECTSEG